MPIRPGKNESQSDWMSRCVPEMLQDGSRDQDQAVAICYQIWRDKDKTMDTHRQLPDPDDYDDEDEFMEDCVDELGDESVCSLIWRTHRTVARRRASSTRPTQATSLVMSSFSPMRASIAWTM